MSEESIPPGSADDAEPQAGVPETTVTDTTPAPGTSEAMPPVEWDSTAEL